jgi:hypothetical protein
MNPKKSLRILPLSIIYYICFILLIAITGISCNTGLSQGNIENSADTILLKFDQVNLEDTSDKKNREVTATFHLPPTVNLQEWKLHVQVQVDPTAGGYESSIDCLSKWIKKLQDPNLDPMASLYHFLPNKQNNQSLTVKFTFKPAVGVSEMKVLFTLLHNNKPTGTPSTVTWQAFSKMQFIGMMDGQEVKYGDKLIVGLENIGERIIHPNEVTIQLSNSNNLQVLNDKGESVTNGADLTAFLEGAQKEPINPYQKVQFALQLQSANDQQLQETQLTAMYKGKVVATKNIKLVSKHATNLKIAMPDQDGAVLKGDGPFGIIIENTGNYPIDLREVGVKVNTSIKFFLNNLSANNSKDDTLAKFCNLEILEKGSKASLLLALQPGTFLSSQLDIVLYELEDANKTLAHRMLTWEYTKQTQLKICQIENSLKIENGQITSQIQLINTGNQRIQFDRNRLILFLEDFSPVLAASVPRFTLHYAIKDSAHQGYLDPNQSVTLTLESNKSDKIPNVDFVSATIAVYYYDGRTKENLNKPLDQLKINWEKKK